MRRWLRFALPLLLAAASANANAALRAWLDNTQISPGETVELTLAHDGQTSSRPDLTALKQDFDIVGSSTSSNLQIVNGKISSTTQLELSLAPKRSGQLIVPSITWDSDRSPRLTLNVTPNGSNGSGNGNGNAGNAAAAANKRIFVETEVEPKSPYVQAAVHVAVRVYAAVPLAHADLEFPDTDAALVRQAGSDAVNTVEKNGQSYQVVTRHYLLFPQHSGHISITGPALSGEIPDRTRALGLSDPFSGLLANSPFNGVFGTTKPIRIHADPIELEVQPRPASAGASYWVPARNVTLQAHWNPSQPQAHVGDPITLDLRLQAEGLTAAQLPDLSTLLDIPTGLKAYPDAPGLKDTPQGNDVVGSRDQNIALIADEPGQFTIPELRLSWWDTRTNQTREAVVPAQTITMLPAAGAAGAVQAPTQSPQAVSATPGSNQSRSPPAASTAPKSQPSATNASGGNLWKWISLAFAALWLGTLAAWLASRRRKHRGPTDATPKGAGPVTDNETSAGPLRSAFLAACRDNDALAARRSLLLWANAAWAGPRIRGVNALAKLLDDAQIARQLQALDRACYASEPWNGAALASALTTLPLPRRAKLQDESGLAPLYR
jgi:BatD DUF11 like domain